jgi:antitoxin FitA
MPVNLSIKNVPDEIALKLKERAERNHRSLQGELSVIIEEAVAFPPPKPKLTPSEVRAHMRALGVRTNDDSVQIIREARDRKVRKLNVSEIVAKVKKLGLPRYDEAAQMIREDRDRS